MHTVTRCGAGGGEVWDVFGQWMLRADLSHSGVGSFASFGECVVTRVKVLALLLAGLVCDGLLREEAFPVPLVCFGEDLSCLAVSHRDGRVAVRLQRETG